MIKINLLSKEQQDLAAAVIAFEDAQRFKSFSERNPHLGRMMNCWVCRTRHRSYIECTPKYAQYANPKDEAERTNAAV